MTKEYINGLIGKYIDDLKDNDGWLSLAKLGMILNCKNITFPTLGYRTLRDYLLDESNNEIFEISPLEYIGPTDFRVRMLININGNFSNNAFELNEEYYYKKLKKRYSNVAKNLLKKIAKILLEVDKAEPAFSFEFTQNYLKIVKLVDVNQNIVINIFEFRSNRLFFIGNPNRFKQLNPTKIPGFANPPAQTNFGEQPFYNIHPFTAVNDLNSIDKYCIEMIIKAYSLS